MDLITSPPSNPKTHYCFHLHALFTGREDQFWFSGHCLRAPSSSLMFISNSKQSQPNKFITGTKPFSHFLTNFNLKAPAMSTNAAIVEATELEPDTGEYKYKRILLPDLIVKRTRNVFVGRKWIPMDVATAGVAVAMHLLSLFAPFQFNWGAFWVAVALYVVTGLFGITLSFHRNLSHKSFKLPKFLKYLFAYCGSQALQCGGSNNAGDLEKQSFYQFLQKTYIAHPIALGLLLYAMGGFPFLVGGMGVRIIWVYHISRLVNSACHVWGNKAWNTGDLSRNNCYYYISTPPYHLEKIFGWNFPSRWVAILAFREGWHNNHHAFEYSARHAYRVITRPNFM